MMPLDLLHDFGQVICQAALSSPRCYDPSSATAIGFAALSALAGVLIGGYFVAR